MDAPPECPEGLRAELAAREREKKPLVSPRVARLIKASPASMRRYSLAAPVEELAGVNFAAIATR
ncbi:MAG: hypothetical protein NT154_05000, partial [Verrucomicrobia bacterium]|nr:hypothetical protein [Verrucomicrobiota bacterium]